MPKVEVQYSSFSNISYKGTRTFDIDDGDWQDAIDEGTTDQLIHEYFTQWLFEHELSWDWKSTK